MTGHVLTAADVPDALVTFEYASWHEPLAPDVMSTMTNDYARAHARWRHEAEHAWPARHGVPREVMLSWLRQRRRKNAAT